MKLCNIYCEGKRGSHDYDILEKVLGDLRPNIEIKPIGGKMGSKAIMSYVEGSTLSAAKADDYLMFRDRDFDKPVPKKEELIYVRCQNLLFSSPIWTDFKIKEKPPVKEKLKLIFYKEKSNW